MRTAALDNGDPTSFSSDISPSQGERLVLQLRHTKISWRRLGYMGMRTCLANNLERDWSDPIFPFSRLLEYSQLYNCEGEIESLLYLR